MHRTVRLTPKTRRAHVWQEANYLVSLHVYVDPFGRICLGLRKRLANRFNRVRQSPSATTDPKGQALILTEYLTCAYSIRGEYSANTQLETR